MSLAEAQFYAILDTAYVNNKQWISKCQALINSGADIIQLRAKQQTHAQRKHLLEAILPLFKSQQSPPLIINDDLELALQYPSVGLHIGQDDTSVKTARAALGPERLLGLSTHSPAQAQRAIEQAQYLSYFAVGPIFSTQTKPDYPPVGLKLIRYVASLQPPIPWFCIGGINSQNVAQIKASGAKRIVAVSAVLNAQDTAKAVSSLTC